MYISTGFYSRAVIGDHYIDVSAILNSRSNISSFHVFCLEQQKKNPVCFSLLYFWGIKQLQTSWITSSVYMTRVLMVSVSLLLWLDISIYHQYLHFNILTQNFLRNSINDSPSWCYKQKCKEKISGYKFKYH